MEVPWVKQRSVGLAPRPGNFLGFRTRYGFLPHQQKGGLTRRRQGRGVERGRGAWPCGERSRDVIVHRASGSRRTSGRGHQGGP